MAEAAPPHPVVLLGDVRQVEEMTEGPGDEVGVLDGQSGKVAAQLLGVPPVTAARALREVPHAFDHLEDGSPGLLGDDIPEKGSQEADVLAECGVRIPMRSHFRSLASESLFFLVPIFSLVLVGLHVQRPCGGSGWATLPLP